MSTASVEHPAVPHAAPVGALHQPSRPDLHAFLLALRQEMIDFADIGPWAPTWRDWWKPGDKASKALLADGIQPPGATLTQGRGFRRVEHDISGMIVVTIAPHDRWLAGQLGEGRWIVNRHKRNSPGYSGDSNQPDSIAQVKGVLCEMAVAQHLNCSFDVRHALWRLGEHDGNRGDSDLTDLNVEVRSVRDLRNDAIVKLKDVEEGRTLVITYPLGGDTNQVLIVGCMKASRMWDMDRKPGWWDKKREDGTQRDPWNRDTDDHAVPLAMLSRCTCVWGAATTHECYPADDRPPSNYKSDVRRGPRHDETPALRATRTLTVV